MKTEKTPPTNAIKNVYERMIDVFFHGKSSEALTTLVHQDFLSYGTAAHEFFSNFHDLIKIAQTQSEQLKTHPISITRKSILEKFLISDKSYLIVEEFNMHDKLMDYKYTLRLSTILENFSGQWLTTHVHGSTPDANIDEKEALPIEGLRKKNLELEEKIKERTRELEIEAALERVRSRSLAMHNSSELSAVVDTLLQEFTQLEFTLTFCIINLIDEQDMSNTVWAANPETGKNAESYYMKFEDYPFHHAMWDAWKSQKKRFIYTLEGEKKKIYDEYLFSQTEFKRFPKHVQEANKALERYVAGFTFFKHCGLQTVSQDEITENELEILERFGKVFEQAYTRFLDLQKAEAQAREAQIETALERVRSRSMAMHKSDELQEVIEIVFDQILKLGVMADSANFLIFNHENKDVLLWLAAPNQKIHRSWNVPYTDIYPMNMFLKELENGNDFFMASCSFEQKNKWFNWAFEHSDFKYFPDETKEFILKSKFWSPSYAWLKNTGIQLNSFSRESFTENENEILKRFAKVFEQTYTRFLDLKKSEAQTREAQIETALEKVRSRSLAMHKSEELNQVILEIHQKFQDLDISMESRVAVVAVFDKNSKDFNQYIASHDISNMRISTPYFKHPILDDVEVAKQEGIDFYSKTYSLEEKNSYFKTFFETSDFGDIVGIDEQRKWVLDQKSYTYSPAFQKNSSIGIADYSGIPLTENEIDIIKRFSKVFEQAYIRFLDLQKSEAQTREAKIETALEKVRSRSMAMHKSEELEEVILVVSEQLQQLEFRFDNVSFALDADQMGLNFYLSSPTLPKPLLLNVPYLDNPAFSRPIQARNNGIDFNIDILTRDENQQFLQHMFDHSELGSLSLKNKDFLLSSPGLARSQCLMRNTILTLANYSLIPYSEEQNAILKRFGHVFEQAYTRFLDLKKAEAQAREAKIETALEKVRSRTMAMQKGDELQEVAVLLYKELIALGVTNFVTCGYVEVREDIKRQYTWVTAPGGDTLGLFYLPLTGDATFDARYAAWKRQKPVFHQTVKGEERSKHLEYAITTFNSKEAEEMVRHQFPDPTVFYCFNFSHGYLHLVGGSYLEKEEENLLARFTKVFEQTYTRFLDLQKAEAQAREAKIETALEKVRSRTMGMQSSDELPEVANLLFTEVRGLGINAWSCGYNILAEDKKTATCCMSSEGTLQTPFQLRLWGEASFDEMGDFIKSNHSMLVQELGGQALESHYAYMKSFPDLKPTFDEIDRLGLALPTYQINHLCKFNQGFILFITYEKVPDAHDIFKRFTKVFDQTYTRFLDLQKAEAQAREAQIEASLERVRAKSMSMQNSDELDEVLSVLCEQFDVLGIVPMSTHMTVFDFDNNTFTFRETGKFGNRSFGEQTVALDAMDNWKETVEKWKADKPTAINKLHFPKEQLPEVWEVFHESFASMPEGSRITPEDYPDGIYHTAGKHPFGYIGMNQIRPATIDEEQIVIKFANEFGRAYQRFLDLQKAEAQAKEAKIEVALEKVRSRTMGMQKSDELADVANVLFQEMNNLVQNLWTCGFVLCEKDRQEDEWWLSLEDGFSRGLFLPNVNDYAHSHLYEGWLKKDDFRTVQLEGDDLQAHYDWLMEIPVAKSIFDELEAAGMQRPEWQKLHAAYFSKGYLVIITREPCYEEAIFKRFAQVFDLTYTRFLDLKKAEAQARQAEKDLIAIKQARQKAEEALIELKATQSQLVQQEKLASLGQLTAGIAHEIKNPLNFVNNFSEVSKEMMQEVREEIQTVRAYRDRPIPEDALDEMSAILDDIESNLEKIHNHGTRADSIVKAMLQHSRGGSGKMEPTDLNALIKEYVNLAFHGMRAKKNPINVDIDLQLDPKIKTISLIGEDFSRVILNLTNNAFDAMRETAEIRQAKLTVRTKQESNAIHIEVQDNGPGIPDAIKDKILQPFFTTKKGTEGTGLGLSITNDIIKAHGGELKIDSVIKKSTTLIITLPS